MEMKEFFITPVEINMLTAISIFIIIVILIIILILIILRTHALLELKASIKRKPILLIDTGRDWVLTSAEDDNTGILKCGKNYFIKTRNSIKPDRFKGIHYAVAITEQPYTIPTEIAVATQKSWEEDKPVFNTLLKNDDEKPILNKEGKPIVIEGIENEAKKNKGFFNWKPKEAEKLECKGVTLPFDKVVYFFNSLTSGALYTLVQREVVEQIRDLKKFDWRVVMYVVLFMIGIAVVYVILKGQQPVQNITNLINTNATGIIPLTG